MKKKKNICSCSGAVPKLENFDCGSVQNMKTVESVLVVCTEEQFHQIMSRVANNTISDFFVNESCCVYSCPFRKDTGCENPKKYHNLDAFEIIIEDVSTTKDTYHVSCSQCPTSGNFLKVVSIAEFNELSKDF